MVANSALAAVIKFAISRCNESKSFTCCGGGGGWYEGGG